jgi:hypothetical protein
LKRGVVTLQAYVKVTLGQLQGHEQLAFIRKLCQPRFHEFHLCLRDANHLCSTTLQHDGDSLLPSHEKIVVVEQGVAVNHDQHGNAHVCNIYLSEETCAKPNACATSTSTDWEGLLELGRWLGNTLHVDEV